jgi:hypothetical protein
MCADVYEVLAASHYTLLTKEEWDLATSENFNLNLPMEVSSVDTDHPVAAEHSPNHTRSNQVAPVRASRNQNSMCFVSCAGDGTELGLFGSAWLLCGMC